MSESPSAPTSGATIVVGYVAKAEGRAALDRAVVEARLRNARLLVLHTSADTSPAELEAELTASGVAYEILAHAESEDPADELLTAAEDANADFIVIGLRRRSPVGKLLLGSSSQRVLLDASCPVLAVKAY